MTCDDDGVAQTSTETAEVSCNSTNTGLGECLNDAYRCGDDSERDQCVSGAWTDNACASGSVCDSTGTDYCNVVISTPKCTVGEDKIEVGASICSGNDLVTCNEGATPSSKTCTFGCNIDACISKSAEADDNGGICVDNKLGKLTPDGTAYETEPAACADAEMPNCGIVNNIADCYECVTDAHCTSNSDYGVGYTCVDSLCELTDPQTCEGVDGTSTVAVAHGAWGCSDATHYFKCNNGVKEESDDCAIIDQVCKPGASTGSDSCVECVADSHCDAVAKEVYGEHAVGVCDSDNKCGTPTCEAGYYNNGDTCELIECSTPEDVYTTGEHPTIVAYIKESQSSLETRFACGNDETQVLAWNASDATNPVIVKGDDGVVHDGANHKYYATLDNLPGGDYKCIFEVKVENDWYACSAKASDWMVDYTAMKLTNETLGSDLTQYKEYTSSNTTECVAGATKCVTNNLYTCSDAGAWVAEDPACANGCGEDPDNPGTHKCLDAAVDPTPFTLNASASNSCDGYSSQEIVASCDKIDDNTLKVTLSNGVVIDMSLSTNTATTAYIGLVDTSHSIVISNLHNTSKLSVTGKMGKASQSNSISVRDNVNAEGNNLVWEGTTSTTMVYNISEGASTVTITGRGKNKDDEVSTAALRISKLVVE